MIAPKGRATKSVEFSWDEGQTWEELVISEQSLYVQNIIIEPNSISQQFIIYGTYASENADGEESNNKETAFLTYADFSSLHTRQCVGADNAGAANSDFELWTPYDGRHGDNNKCFLGQQVTYTRRRQDAKCFNGEDYEAVTSRTPCSCTEMDYECDFGYQRTDGGLCEKRTIYQDEKK